MSVRLITLGLSLSYGRLTCEKNTSVRSDTETSLCVHAVGFSMGWKAGSGIRGCSRVRALNINGVGSKIEVVRPGACEVNE